MGPFLRFYLANPDREAGESCLLKGEKGLFFYFKSLLFFFFFGGDARRSGGSDAKQVLSRRSSPNTLLGMTEDLLRRV